MKKYSKHKTIFRNFYLTDLMVIKKGKRKGLGDNMSVITLTNALLEPYGINLWGGWTGIPDLTLRLANLDEKFPIKNFPILKQMYSWLDVDIYIMIERTENFENGFFFNNQDDKVRMVKYVWGSIEKEIIFNSFAEMWKNRKDF